MMTEIDVCLISSKAPRIGEENVFPLRNLGLALIASNLRANNYSVEIFNAQADKIDIDQMFEKIQSRPYRFFGISVLSIRSWTFARELIFRMRKSGFQQPIIVGGIFATFNYHLIFEDCKNGEVDCVSLGEGEKTILELVDRMSHGQEWNELDGIVYLKDKKVIVNPAKCIQDLDSLPYASDDEVPALLKKKQLINIQTSRGCYGTCTYCSIRHFYGEGGKNWRYRSPESVIDEVEMWIEKFGARKFIFVDDNFVGPGKLGRNRAMKICQLLVERNIRIEFFMECRPNDLTEELTIELSKAGCKYIFLGFESGSTKQLKEVGKGDLTKETNLKVAEMLLKHQIKFFPGFIMFTPECTLDDLRDNIKILRDMYKTTIENSLPVFLSTYIPFTVLEPMKGAEVHEQLLRDKRLSYDPVGKHLVYVIRNPRAEMVRRLFVGSGLHEYIRDLEKDILQVDFEDENIEQREILDGYEKDRMYLLLDYLEKIIHDVETEDLSDYYASLMAIKKKVAIMAVKCTNRLKEAIRS